MIETVFALILTLNGNMIEHVYKPSLSDCLKSKRIAQNEVNPERVVFTCKKVKAQTEIYMDRKKNKLKYCHNGTIYTSKYYHSFYIALCCNICRFER